MVLDEEGRRCYEDLAVPPQLPIVFPPPRQLLALHGREARLALRAIGAGLVDPESQRRRRQIQVARDGPDRLALLEDPADRLGLELIRELPARAPGWEPRTRPS